MSITRDVSVFVTWVSCVFVAKIMWIAVLPKPATAPGPAPIATLFSEEGFCSAMFTIALAVMVEELVRLAPVFLAHRFGGSVVLVRVVSALTATGFGLAHMSNGLPMWFVLCFQGVSGLLLNETYLRFGGLDGSPKTGLLCSYAMHMAWDALCIVIGIHRGEIRI